MKNLSSLLRNVPSLNTSAKSDPLNLATYDSDGDPVVPSKELLERYDAFFKKSDKDQPLFTAEELVLVSQHLIREMNEQHAAKQVELHHERTELEEQRKALDVQINGIEREKVMGRAGQAENL